jgi:hypothetical protein
MHKILFFPLFTIFLISLAACQGDTQKLERMPGIDLPLQEMNKDLHLKSPTEINTFQMGDVVWLLLFNTSDLPAVFPGDYGVHIFRLNDDHWDQVEELTDFWDSDNWVLANGSETRLSEAVSFYPAVFDTEPTKIRIIVLGNFVKNNGKLGKVTGAYVDVTLNP